MKDKLKPTNINEETPSIFKLKRKDSSEKRDINEKVTNKKTKEKFNNQRAMLKWCIIGGIIFLICFGYVLYKESKIRDLNNQKAKITNDYDKLKSDYAKLQKAHKKLQNLPDATVYADVDGKKVELTFYSTIEEAEENVKNLEYEHFFIDDVELTISVHNKKQIEEMRWTNGKHTFKIFPDPLVEYTSKAYQIDNDAYICAINTASETKNQLSLLIDGKKMYTVFYAVEY